MTAARRRLASLVLLLTLVVTSAGELLSPPRATAASDLGLPFFGLFMHGHDRAATARAASSAAGVATIEIHWRDLEPVQRADGSWDGTATAALDARLANLAANGLVPLAVVGWAPWWAATNPRGPLFAGKETAYLAFLDKLVRRYGGSAQGVRHWMLWPEPDAVRAPLQAPDRGSWGDDAAAFAALLQSSYRTVKSADASARVILGPLAHDSFYDPPAGATTPAKGGSSPGYNDGGIFRYAFLDEVLAVPGTGAAFDALGINAYPAFSRGWEAHSAAGVDVAAKISHVRARLAARGLDKPIVVGEVGFWSVGATIESGERTGASWDIVASAETQAAYVAKVFARARDAGAAAVVWFTLDDYSSLPTKYGLVDTSTSPKPAYLAYRWAATALGDRARTPKPAWLIPLEGKVESYAFGGGGRWTVVAWATGSAAPRARVAVSAGTRAYDRSGIEVVAASIDGSGGQVYELGGSPMFFERTHYVGFVPLSPLRASATR